jgi:hypothetical protein
LRGVDHLSASASARGIAVTRLIIIFALAGAVIVLVLFANLLLVATNAGAQTTTFRDRGSTPARLVHTLGDADLYLNHLDFKYPLLAPSPVLAFLARSWLLVAFSADGGDGRKLSE